MGIVRGSLIVIVIAATAGCSFRDGVVAGDGGTGDGKKDGGNSDGKLPDGPPGQPCFGPAGWSVCVDAMPVDTIVLRGPFDTSSSNTNCIATPADWLAQGQPDACIVIHGDLTFSGQVTGPRPLVLVGATKLTIDMLLDVSSHRGSTDLGAGSPSLDCDAATDPGSSGGGGGGGAGGSFIALGGAGGAGGGGTGSSPGMNVSTVPTKLRAGCPGKKGGDGNGGEAAGAPGAGGGAVYLLSGGVLTMSSQITVSGAGGAGGETHTGGSGGGSGGMIAIHALSINATGARLSANGGGGSAGGSPGSGGANGDDPNPANPVAIALGGPQPVIGGHGYAGGMSATGGATGPNNNGGGGGGGSQGYIGTNMLFTAIVSPTLGSFP
jgi:hypothetical protein